MKPKPPHLHIPVGPLAPNSCSSHNPACASPEDRCSHLASTVRALSTPMWYPINFVYSERTGPKRLGCGHRGQPCLPRPLKELRSCSSPRDFSDVAHCTRTFVPTVSTPHFSLKTHLKTASTTSRKLTPVTTWVRHAISATSP